MSPWILRRFGWGCVGLNIGDARVNDAWGYTRMQRPINVCSATLARVRTKKPVL